MTSEREELLARLRLQLNLLLFRRTAETVAAGLRALSAAVRAATAAFVEMGLSLRRIAALVRDIESAAPDPGEGGSGAAVDSV